MSAPFDQGLCESRRTLLFRVECILIKRFPMKSSGPMKFSKKFFSHPRHGDNI